MKFIEKATLTRHQRQKHTFEKLFKCLLCFKEFVTNNVRKLHLQSHIDIKLCQSETYKQGGK